MNGFSAEEFEPDAVDDTAGDTSNTTAKVDGAGDTGSTGGNGNTNAGSAPGGNAGNTNGGAGGNSTGGNNDWPVLGAAAYHGLAGEVVNALAPQTEAGQFIGTGPLTTARARHSATLLPDGRVLVAGGGVTGQWTSRLEIYNPAT